MACSFSQNSMMGPSRRDGMDPTSGISIMMDSTSLLDIGCHNMLMMLVNGDLTSRGGLMKSSLGEFFGGFSRRMTQTLGQGRAGG